jgi:tetratricopeptide (TPR) repeat protein
LINMSEELVTAEQASNDMLAAAAFIAQHIKNEGQAEAMKAVVPGYLTRGEVDIAAEFANTVDDPYTRDRLLIRVAEKCAELGDDEYGLQLADVIEDLGMQSEARERVAIQKSAVGDFDRAAAIAENVLHPDYVFAEMAAGLAKAGREQELEEVLGKIELPVAKASAFQAIAAWHLAEGRNDEAVVSLSDAAASAGEIEHGEERVRSLGEIANSFIDAGRKDLAIETFHESQSQAETLGGAHREMFLSAIAIGIAKAGDIDAADEVLDIVADRTQIASGLLGFARILWDNSEKDEAMESLEEAYSLLRSQKENEIRDSRAANALTGLIAAQFALFDRPERAIEVAQENRDENEKVNALSRIAQTFTLHGDQPSAELATRAIADESQRLTTMFGIAEAHFQNGANEKMLAALDAAAELAADLPQPRSRASALYSAAAYFREYGAPEKAQETARKALAAIGEIRSDSARAVSLASLSELFEKGGLELGDAERKAISLILHESED